MLPGPGTMHHHCHTGPATVKYNHIYCMTELNTYQFPSLIMSCFFVRGVDSADGCVSPGPPDSDRQSEEAANPRGEINSPSCVFTAPRECDVLHNCVKV